MFYQCFATYEFKWLLYNYKRKDKYPHWAATCCQTPPHCLEVLCIYIILLFGHFVFCWCWWWNGSRLSHRLFQFSYHVSRWMILTCDLLYYHYYFKPWENISTAAWLGALISLKQYGLHFSNGNVALNMIKMFDLVSWFVPIQCYSKIALWLFLV